MEGGGFILQVIFKMESASNTILVSAFLHLLFPTSCHFCLETEQSELDISIMKHIALSAWSAGEKTAAMKLDNPT